MARSPPPGVKGDSRSLPLRSSAPPRPKHEARLSPSLGTPNSTRGKKKKKKKGSTWPALERRNQPREQWGVQLRTDVANADGSTPTHFTLEYSHRPLDLNSGPHSNSSRDAARDPQAASPGSQQQELTHQAAASRGHCRGQAGRGPGRRGQVRAGERLEARRRLAPVPAAPPRGTRLPGTQSPTWSRRRQACARPRAAPRPGRSAGSAGHGATASPW